MIDRATIQARRIALDTQIAQARLAYADLEVARDQALAALAELQRQLDAMHGGLQELDGLLCDDAPASIVESGDPAVGGIGAGRPTNGVPKDLQL